MSLITARGGRQPPTDNIITPAQRRLAEPINSNSPYKKNKFRVVLTPLSNSPLQAKTSDSEQSDGRSGLLRSPRLAPIKFFSPPGNKRHSHFDFKTGCSKADLIDEDDANKTMEEMMRTTDREEVIGDDEKPKETVGQKAIGDYYSHFKKLDKVKDQNTYREIKDSAYTSFLSKSEDLRVLPSKIGFIKERGPQTVVEINHYKIGDRYAEVLGEGLKNNSKVNRFNLSNNRLTPKGAEFILSRVSRNAQVIDLSHNNIGRVGCEHLVRIIEYKNTNLHSLNLEGNKLGDQSIMLICEALVNNRELAKLNLAKNNLTNICTEKLGVMLEKNENLKELYLYWNQIQGPGGNSLLKGLTANTNLKILDLAWNSLGLYASTFSKNLSDFIAANTELVVLNLSNNNLSKDDAKLIAEGLEKNHTLYECQFQGNYGYIDTFGFLNVPDVLQSDSVSQHIATHSSGKYPNPDLLKRYENITEEVFNGCWISEGWRSVQFTWTPGESGDAFEDPVYLHMVHDGNHSIWLPSHLNYTLEIMCPPGAIQYFFTANNVQVAAQDQPHESAKDSGDIYGKPFTITHLNKVNVYHNDIDKHILDSNCEVTCDMKPRIRPEAYIAPEIEKEKIPWTLPLSLFKDFKSDNDDMLRRCFENDFETSRIQKVVKKPEELEKVKQSLWHAYKQLKGAYKYLSAVGAADVWSIGTNVFTDFLSKCSMIDDTLRLKDADLKFIATYTKTDPAMMKNHRNPDRVLVRYQFLEIWVRLAEQKFIGNGIVNNFPDAVEKVLHEHILPYVKSNDSFFLAQKWRLERYWNEQVDTVYKSYLPVVQGLYRKYSGQKTKPGMKKFMCVDELMKLSTESSILNDNLVDRDIVVTFNLSMMTQVDELTNDRIFQMSFIEFLEALARLADVYSAYSPGEEEGSVTLEARKARPLHLKLEGLICLLYYRVCDNAIKDIYIIPEKSIFDEPNTGAVSPVKRGGKKKCIVRVDPVQFYYASTVGSGTIATKTEL